MWIINILLLKDECNVIPFIWNLEYAKLIVIRSIPIGDKIMKKWKEMIIAKNWTVTTSNVIRQRTEMGRVFLGLRTQKIFYVLTWVNLDMSVHL